ncbi:MAG: hypothetical protein Q7W30_08700 [Coriobacteriia bacterium]|nr:hypothetical protein [Coriobacteriia bacterium]
MAVAAALLAMVVALSAAPVSAAPQSVASKRAAVAAAITQLAALREELGAALDEHDQASDGLDAARMNTLTTEEELLRLDAEVADRQQAFDDRAAAMYRTGGLDLVEALLSSGTFDDLFSRLDLLSYIQTADADMLAELAAARSQSEFLREQQAQRESDFVALRKQADARQRRVDVAIAQQQAFVKSLGAELARLVREQEAADAAAAAAGAGGSGGTPQAFDPNTVITDAAFLDADSMSPAAIQAFLDRQPGTLKSYSAPDHAGVRKTTAQMISDAAYAWGVSPKCIIVTLQKEQSLITRTNPTQNAYDWATGCGKADSHTYTQYKGFGNQIWWGAQKLKHNRESWHAGGSLPIDGKAVYPTNASTHSLYRYTPHFPGVTSFWRIYWRFFGSPLT